MPQMLLKNVGAYYITRNILFPNCFLKISGSQTRFWESPGYNGWYQIKVSAERNAANLPQKLT